MLNVKLERKLCNVVLAEFDGSDDWEKKKREVA